MKINPGKGDCGLQDVRLYIIVKRLSFIAYLMGANDFLYSGSLRGTNLTQFSVTLSGLLYEPGEHW